MFIAMFIFFLHCKRVSMYSETTGHEIFYIRRTDHLSWITAREACDNMSHAILPGMRDTRALGLLNVGEFAWIDGKEYAFCLAKNVNETQEICRYVTVTREDIKENLTYICNKDGEFKRSEEILSYTDAVKSCQKSSASLQVVENFVIPMVVPVNRTDWIKDYNSTRIMSTLGPGQKVNESCIGIVRLESERFEFGTTSCDENHTVICDASAVRTALTFTTREEMMPRLGDIQARLASNQPRAVDMKSILLVSALCVIAIVMVVIAIVYCWKRRSDINNLQDVRRMRSLSCNNFKVKHSTQGQSNHTNHRKGDLGCHSNDQEPIDDYNSSNLCHLKEGPPLVKQAVFRGQETFSGNNKCLFPPPESHATHKYLTMSGKEREKRNIVKITDEENQYDRLLDDNSKFPKNKHA